MPEYSGVAAVLPQAGPPHEQPAGDQLMGFMERFMQIRNAQKQQATTQLESAVRMASQFGFMMDPKQIAKLVKKSGLPISMKDEDITAGIVAHKNDQQQKQPGVTTGGAGAAGIAATAGAAAGQVGQQQQQQKPPAQMTSAEKTGMWVNQMAARAQKMMNLNAQTDEAKANNNLLIEQLKTRAIGGDKEAAGKLIGLNQWKFDVEWEKWQQMSPSDRVNFARGGETPGDLAKRETGIAESLVNHGYADPQNAFQAARSLAAGQPIPPGVNVKPKSFEDLNNEVQLTEKIADMFPGITGDQLRGAVNAAVYTGDLTKGLPSNLKPTTPGNRQAAIQEKELGVEQQRVGIEKLRLAKEVEVAAMQATSAAAKQELEEAKAVIELAKSGKVDPAVAQAAQVKLADALGMDAQRVKTWWDYVTFSDASGVKYSPRLTDSGKDTVHKFAGKSKPKSSEPSILQQMMGNQTKKEPI